MPDTSPDLAARAVQALEALERIEKGLGDRFVCTRKKWKYLKQLRGFLLTVKLADPPAPTAPMSLLKIQCRYTVSYLATCNVEHEVKVITEDDWPA